MTKIMGGHYPGLYTIHYRVLCRHKGNLQPIDTMVSTACFVQEVPGKSQLYVRCVSPAGMDT